MLLCDNLRVSAPTYHAELSEILLACTGEELRFIREAIPALLSAYRCARGDQIKTVGEK